MSASNPPPSEIPHHKKTNTGLIVLGVLLLLGTGAAVLFKLSKGEAAPVVEEVRVKQEKKEEEAPVLADAPPPPPSEEELAAAEKQAAAPKAEGDAPKFSGPPGCGGVCGGSATAELQNALRTKGGQARGCYNRALRLNSSLEGKMTVAMRLSPSGAVCGASAASDTLNDPAVTSCVLQMFRAGKYPAPQGGCADTQIPLNFVSKQ